MRRGALLLLLLAAACARRGEPTTASDELLASLLPGDALAIVRVSSLDELNEAGTRLAALSPIPLAPSLPGTASLVAGGAKVELETNVPCAIALFPPARGGRATVAGAVRVRDVEAALRSLGGVPAHVRDGYVALCEDSPYEPRASPLWRGLKPGMVSARVDMARAMERYGDWLHQLADDLSGAFSSIGRRLLPKRLDRDGLDRRAKAWLRDVFESCATADLVVDLESDVLRLELAYQPKRGTTLATMAASRNRLGELLRFSPHAPALTVLLSSGGSGLVEATLDALGVPAGDDLRGGWGAECAIWLAVADSGPTLVAAFPAAGAASRAEAVASRLGASAPPREVAGFAVRRARIPRDALSLLPPGLPLPPGGLVCDVAAREGAIAIFADADGAAADAILGGGRAPAEEWGGTPLFLARFDVRALARIAGLTSVSRTNADGSVGLIELRSVGTGTGLRVVCTLDVEALEGTIRGAIRGR